MKTNFLINHEEIDELAALLVNAKDRIAFWSDNYMTENHTPKLSADGILENELTKWAAKLETLPRALALSKEPKEPKWVRLEEDYFKITGEEIKIDNQVEFENATFLLNKYYTENQ